MVTISSSSRPGIRRVSGLSEQEVVLNSIKIQSEYETTLSRTSSETDVLDIEMGCCASHKLFSYAREFTRYRFIPSPTITKGE